MASNPLSENQASEAPSPAPLTSDQLLPPIEPPSAGFILQLFVVPAVIVLAVVLISLLITTVATRGDQDPERIVAALRSSNQARWQKADELANMLRMEKRYPELKSNHAMAFQLAELLNAEVDAGRDDENSIKLRYFLSRVLGEFYVDDGLEVLLKTAREDPERDVRRESVNALAVLAHTFHTMDPPQLLEHPQLVNTLIELANEPDDLIRSQAAFAIGVVAFPLGADPRLTAELEVLVDDLYPDARYNAALALARQGNLLAEDAVREMLTAEALQLSTSKEVSSALQAFKRNTILSNALDAAETLLEKNPLEEPDQLRTALKQFVEEAPTWQLESPVPGVLIERGHEVLENYTSRRKPATPR